MNIRKTILMASLITAMIPHVSIADDVSPEYAAMVKRMLEAAAPVIESERKMDEAQRKLDRIQAAHYGTRDYYHCKTTSDLARPVDKARALNDCLMSSGK